MDSRWLSNAFVVGDEPGGTAVFVDSGAPLEPLVEALERERLTPTHILRTHGHADHVEHEDELAQRYGIPVVTGSLATGGLSIEAIATPGHSDDGIAFVVNDTLCFSGDTLFRDAVGGGPADEVRQSVMDRLMTLPHDCGCFRGTRSRRRSAANGSGTPSSASGVASKRRTGAAVVSGARRAPCS